MKTGDILEVTAGFIAYNQAGALLSFIPGDFIQIVAYDYSQARGTVVRLGGSPSSPRLVIGELTLAAYTRPWQGAQVGLPTQSQEPPESIQATVQIQTPIVKRCECGAHAVNVDFHSTWCALFKEDAG